MNHTKCVHFSEENEKSKTYCLRRNCDKFKTPHYLKNNNLKCADKMKMLIIPVTFEISKGNSNFNQTFLNSRVIIRYSKESTL